jgi:hypothetical protein
MYAYHKAADRCQRDLGMTVKRPNTLAGLIEKRREIAGKIEHHQRVLNELIIDLDHVNHTIRLFDPDCDVQLAQPKCQRAPHDARPRGSTVKGSRRRAQGASVDYGDELQPA